MIIDAHNHPDWHGHSYGRYLQNMETYGIDRTWLLSWEVPPDEYDPVYNHTSLATAEGPISFEGCLRYKERAPERFVLGYAPDPRRPDAIDRLRAAIDLYGVQVYGELKLRMMLDNLDALAVFRFCGEQGLPVTVHIDYAIETGSRYPRPNWWYGGPIEALERALVACPETTFIGHAPGFWAHISAGDEYAAASYPTGPVIPGGKLVEMFRQYANLYADLSANSAFNALSRDRDFGRAFLIEFQDRFLFGRDCFDDRMQRFLEGLALPKDVLAKILAGNALRLAPVHG
jgi:predicted TIM-barrel fold metal-dependent hydrolase